MKSRKHSKSVILLAFLLAVLPAIRGSAEEAEEIYQKNLKAIQDDYTNKLAALSAEYAQSLNNLEQASQKKGDLDGVLGAQKEKKRFESDQTVPLTPSADVLPAIGSLQAAYQKTNAKLDAAKNRQILSLADQYAAKLEALKRKLTMDGKIDEASKVAEDKNKLADRPEVAAAKFALADYDSRTAKSPSVPVKPAEPKVTPPKNSVAGILTGKGPDWIEIQPDGEKKLMRYTAVRDAHSPDRPDQKALTAVKQLVTPNRVKLTLNASDTTSFSDAEMVIPASKSGTLKGTVVDKGPSWIDIQPTGGPTERYSPEWKGGMPADGGGLDKNTIAAIAKTKVGDKVTVKWVYEMRRRVTDIQ